MALLNRPKGNSPMIKNRFGKSFIPLLSVLLLMAFFIVDAKGRDALEIRVDAALSQLPLDSQEATHQWVNYLLDMGPEAFEMVYKRILPLEQADSSQIHFALTSASFFNGTSPDTAFYADRVVMPLFNACMELGTPELKKFFLQRLYFAQFPTLPPDTFIDGLLKCLDTSELIDPTLRVLESALRGKDAQALCDRVCLALIERLKTAEGPYKLSYIQTLGALGNQKAVEPIGLIAVQAVNVTERIAALEAIAEMTPDDCQLNALRSIFDRKLKTENLYERSKIAAAYARYARGLIGREDIDPVALVDAVAKKLLELGDIASACDAMDLYVSLDKDDGWRELLLYVDADNSQLRNAVLDRFQPMPHEAFSLLCFKLTDPLSEPEVVADTLYSLTERVSSNKAKLDAVMLRNEMTELFNALAQLICSDDQQVQLTAIRAIGRLSPTESPLPEAAQILPKFLDSEDELIRKTAAEALGQIDAKFYADTASEWYQRFSATGREALIDFFGSHPSDAGRDFLIKVALDEADHISRLAAIKVFADWPAYDENLTDALTQGSFSDNDKIKTAARRGLLRLIRLNPTYPTMQERFFNQVVMSYAFEPSAINELTQSRILSDLQSGANIVNTITQLRAFLSNAALRTEAAMTILELIAKTDKTGGLDPDFARAALNEIADNENLSASLRTQAGEQAALHPPKGFVPLFNGKNLDGWKGLLAAPYDNPIERAGLSLSERAKRQATADDSMRAHWGVEYGSIAFDGKGESLSTTRDDWSDFELYVDWKILENGDSGIYLRGSPQVQIWDARANPEGSGAFYNNVNHPRNPDVCADHPINQWNSFRIRMIGEKVDVYLNGVLVVDNVTMENYWDRSRPIFEYGPIELQNHGNKLWFRNIFIREIKNPHEKGWTPLFNGRDLSGWEVAHGEAGSWFVENGLLVTNGSGDGWLSTTREYSDFEIELSYKLPPYGNSGLFLRTPRDGNPAYVGLEIQILDDDDPGYKELQPYQYTGSVYGVVPSKRGHSFPPWEWQTMRVRYEGHKIRVWLNDFEVTNADLSAFISLADHPGIRQKQGFIGLQNHSTRVEFRNIRIRELSSK